jgi:hypothetical protein
MAIKKKQEVKFKSVEEMLDTLPADELDITKLLQKIVRATIPGVTEKLIYNAIYYQRHKNICFIWPASVLWGSRKTRDGVRFGFINGHQLQDEEGYLDKGERKQVYWKDFYALKDVDPGILQSLIMEATIIDEQLPGKKYLK